MLRQLPASVKHGSNASESVYFVSAYHQIHCLVSLIPILKCFVADGSGRVLYEQLYTISPKGWIRLYLWLIRFIASTL